MMGFDYSKAGVSGGQFVKWSAIGDVVEGDVTVIGMDGTDFNGNTCLQLELNTLFGEHLVMGAHLYDLKRQLKDLNIQAGDRLRVEFTGLKELPGKSPMKLFKVDRVEVSEAEQAAAAAARIETAF